MPMLMNAMYVRMQSSDLSTSFNVGQSIVTARRGLIKRNQGYGVNTGNFQVIPSIAIVQDSDLNDSMVFMPLMTASTSVSD